MAEKFGKGDKVEWRAGAGKTSGTVQEKITDSKKVEGEVAASADDPRYLVENDSTGKVTGHKPETLSPIESDQNPSQEYSADRREHYIKQFQEAVNMTSKELQDWLETEESKSVGQKKAGNESIGHKSGKRIVEILGKNKADYTDDDIDQMKRVVSYVHRHLAQKPSGDIKDTPWRYSLMNWGQDPLFS